MTAAEETAGETRALIWSPPSGWGDRWSPPFEVGLPHDQFPRFSIHRDGASGSYRAHDWGSVDRVGPAVATADGLAAENEAMAWCERRALAELKTPPEDLDAMCATSNMAVWAQPMTYGDSWCGEHRPKESSE